MAADESEKVVQVLAEQLGLAIAPEHLGEAAAAWRLMKPHLDRVSAAEIAVDVEPAPLFRP